METRVGLSTFDDVKMMEQLPVNNGTSNSAVKDGLGRIEASRPQGASTSSSLDLNSVMKTVSLDMFGMDRLDTKGVLVLLVAGKPSPSSASSSVFDVASKERIEALQKSGIKNFHILCFVKMT